MARDNVVRAGDLENIQQLIGLPRRMNQNTGSDGAVELCVQDNGVGLDTGRVSELVRLGHFGLAGMRERVEAAGGRWSLRSSSGHGVEIMARIPAAAASA